MTEDYETLRATVLGETLGVEARSGLALLLRRGMWAWAQAASAPRSVSQSSRSQIPDASPDDEQRTVVRLLAALAMRTKQGRKNERVAQSTASPSRA